MNEKNKISVIMGVYNSQDEYKLRKSIESILNQTYTNFEFIICNDCSTKEFIKPVLEEYKNKDSRIIVIENETNKGLAYSLNHCLEHATGKYIARQDDDDISLPTRFKKEVDILDKNQEISIVGSNIWLYDNNQITGKRDMKEYPIKKNLLFGVTFAHPTIMVRKEAFDKVGNYSIDPIIRRTEDYDLYFKLEYYGYKGMNIQERLYLYSEDMFTMKKQKFRYRVDEVKLRKKYNKLLHLNPKGYLYLLKPIISGLTPGFIRLRRKKKKFSLNHDDIKLIENLKLNEYLK